MQEQGTMPVASSPSRVEQSQETTQLTAALGTFTFFPKLPIEVRLMIWPCSFPRGREVNFGNQLMFNANWTAVMSCIFQFEEPSPLSIALRVNRESRQETLKHYTILFRGDSQIAAGQTKPVQRPFCYNPKLDTAWINPLALQLICWDGAAFVPDPWLPYLASAAPSVFPNTRILEIRGWYKMWPSVVQLGRAPMFYAAFIGEIHCTVPVGHLAKPLHQYLSPQLEPLLQFRGSDELKLIPYRNNGSAFSYAFTHILNGQSEKRYLQGVKEFLVVHKDNFGGKSPVLTIAEQEG
jgi:hypothetical protein